jgi:hypothetical protein
VADDISAFLGRRTYYAVILLVFAVAVIPGFGAGMILFPLFSFSMPIMLARKVFFYMAHSEIYRDYSSRSWVLFLVLTVMFPILSPVLLFVLRDNVPVSAPRAGASPPNAPVPAPPRAGSAYSSAQEYSAAAGYSRYPQQTAPVAARQASPEAPAEIPSEAHPEAPPEEVPAEAPSEAPVELPPEEAPSEASAELPPTTEEPAGAPQPPAGRSPKAPPNNRRGSQGFYEFQRGLFVNQDLRENGLKIVLGQREQIDQRFNFTRAASL